MLLPADFHAAAGEDEALHVALLCPPQSHDALLGHEVERDGVDALHVDHHEALARVAADLLLEVDDGADALVSVLALRGNELLALLGVAVEEPGVDLALLVLEGDVAREDEAVLEALGHVRVAGAVVQHQALNQLAVSGELVLHVHDLNHVQVDGHVRLPDAQDGVRDDVCELVRESLGELGAEGGLGDAEEGLAVIGVDRHLGRLDVLEESILGKVKPLQHHQQQRSYCQQGSARQGVIHSRRSTGRSQERHQPPGLSLPVP